ncbi:hypothetical protein JB92DRAFT_3127509 [Gautieria morchelliformis]|nr:hypothetical protein JB92DRAFT_3127509 [Gautieria morchelliformis]
MDEMVHALEEKRLPEKKGICSRPAAHLNDVRVTTKGVGEEVLNLQKRCAMVSFSITVRTDPSHANLPLNYHDAVSQDFIELLFGMDIDDFALKMEAYALFRIKGIAKNNNDRKTMTKRIVCVLVKHGLREITGEYSLDMEWKRYESKIVDTWRVELVGWPVKEFDPYVLGVKDLETCVAALKGPDPVCYWRKLDDEELTQHHTSSNAKKASGEIVTKQRKKRSDAGKKRGSKTRPRDDGDKENER